MSKPICLIPARAGSKGLADKNMLFFDGKPMIYHTIDAAIESGMFNKEDIYVSTDSLLYKEICEEREINVILRAEHLASDTATSYEVNEDFLKNFSRDQIFVLLQVTSPMRDGQDIKEALELYRTSGADHLVSYTKADKSPELYVSLDERGYIQGNFGIDRGYRRQDRKEYYVPNGAMYISTKGKYLEDKSYFTDKTCAYIMSKKKSIDIDDRLDFNYVLGSLHFDYKEREQREKNSHRKEYTQQSNNSKKNLVIGDSRLLDFNLENYTNLSLPGATLHTFMENKDLFLTKETEKIIVSIGVNDVIKDYSDESIKEQFSDLVNVCKNLDIEIKLTSISFTIFRTVSNTRLLDINNFLKDLSDKNEVEFLEINDYLSKDGRLNFKYTNDGLHFNGKGQEIFYNKIKELARKK